MSTARGALSVVGQAVGAYFGGPIGAAVGGIIGGEVGGIIDGPPEGPRLDDLSAPQIQYGGKIPRFYGGPRWFEIAPLWMTEKREDSETVGGKGGDSGVEQFSYRIDMLVRVCESREGTPCEVIAVTGVEVDGQLVWTSLADASAESIAASAEQEIWADMAVQLGHEDQAPWSVMEAAVGAANANAYRGYLTVGFQDFLLGHLGAPRRVRIQAITAGTQESDVFLLMNFENGNGSTFVDESSRNYTVTAINTEITVGAARFGSGGATNTEVINSASGFATSVSEDWTIDDDYTGEIRVAINGDPNATIRLVGIGTNDGVLAFTIYDNTSPDFKNFRLEVFDEFVDGDVVTPPGPPEYPVGFGGSLDITLDWDGASRTARAIIGGAVVLQHTYTGSAAPTLIGTAYSMSVASTGMSAGTWEADGARHTMRRRYVTSLAMPDAAPTDDGNIWHPTDVDLRDILEYEATRCAPLTLSNIDFSAAEGIDVECHVGVGSAAEVMQPLLTRFWFDLYSADKLYLVRRGGNVEQTIAYRWTGAGVGGRSEVFAGLKRSNDVEVGRKKAITYSNVLADGEEDTRTGDRESISSDVDTLSMNLSMRPSEAQGLADTATADARVAGHTATVRLGARHGLLLQAGSVLEFVDHHGNTYRTLVRRAVWDRWVWEVEVRLDDPAVLQAAGIAVDLDQRALTVAPPPEATLYVLDIPLLRLEDDGPGEYVAVTQTGRWRGVDILKSSDDVTYSVVAEVTNRATAGVCDSALPAYEGWGWDNSSTLTVTLDDGAGGTLSSATKAAIEADRSLNLAVVYNDDGPEVIQFATATLITGTTYELGGGILRNLLGTEWANGLHAVGDKFVLINAALANVPGSVADLGQTRYYKARPPGRSAGSIDPVSIVCTEQRLLPYAPVDVRNDGGTVVWNRRSRISGAVGIEPPLGEASERYDAELYDGATLEDSASALTTPEWTPSTDPSGLEVHVYQLSELVGRGHVAEKVLS